MEVPLRKTGPTKICYDCDHELYPRGKIIPPNDILAKQDRSGKSDEILAKAMSKDSL